jgi:hypothetical protein
LIAGGICTLLIAACGGFDSASSGEHLIKTYYESKFERGKMALSVATCPTGVSEKAGGSFTCQVVVHDVKTRLQHTGTITIHMLAGNKVSIDGSRDVHIR